jgi:hypothetical protein
VSLDQDFGALDSLVAEDFDLWWVEWCFLAALEEEAEASDEELWANTGPASRTRLTTVTSFLNIEISTASDRSDTTRALGLGA